MLRSLKKSALAATREPILLVIGLLLLFFSIFLVRIKDFDIGDTAVKTPRPDSKATIDDSTAIWIADSLEAAMETFGGQDEKRIFELLAPLSLADFNKVYNAFGLKYYSQTFGEGGVPGFTDRLDLIGWLRSELTIKEINELKALNPQLPF